MTVSERRFDATPDEVFACLIDAESYPEWLVGAHRVRILDPSWPRPGSSFEHQVGAGPVEVHDATSVESVVPNRSFDLLIRARPFLVADVHFEVIPAGDQTVLRMVETMRGRFKVLSPVAAPLVRLRNDRSLHLLAVHIARRTGRGQAT